MSIACDVGQAVGMVRALSYFKRPRHTWGDILCAVCPLGVEREVAAGGGERRISGRRGDTNRPPHPGTSGANVSRRRDALCALCTPVDPP